MSGLATPAARFDWAAGASVRRELVKVSAFFLRNWRMTYRNAFTVFEIVFWPIVNLLSVGLLITFLPRRPERSCSYWWGRSRSRRSRCASWTWRMPPCSTCGPSSIKHQLVAPIRPWHLVLGSWLMGLVRGTAVFALQAAVSHWVFGVNVLAHGLAPAVALLAGLLLSAAGVGLLVSTLLMLFGLRAEVSAWSGVSLVLLLCGVYYPVSVLPAPLQAVAAGVPLTHFLEAFRAHLGYAPVFTAPLLRGYGLAVLYVAGGYALFAWAIHRARRTGMLLKLSD